MALVVGVIVFNEQRTKAAPVAQPDVDPAWIDRNVLGSPEAPLVVYLWEDFLCPSCQTFARTVKPQLVEEYVKTGKIRLEYNYFPLGQHEPGATMSALAAELDGIALGDQRLNRRARRLLGNPLVRLFARLG